MSLTIISLGHGGGVPVFPYGTAGNTNFALVPGRHEGPVVGILRSNPYWLIDCGPETLMRIAGTGQIPEPMVQNLQGVIVTHCHGDHSGGLYGLAWRTHFIEERKVNLVYREELIPFLEDQLIEIQYLSGDTPRVPWTYYWETVACSPTRIWMDLGDFKICFFKVDHNIPGFPSFGVEVQTVEGGRAVFSGDSAHPIDAHRFSGADVVFHDVQFYTSDPRVAVHCPYEALETAVSPELRKKVHLAHTGQKPPGAALEAFSWASLDTIVVVD